MEALGINLGYIFVQIFNFAILFLVLRAWVYEPIINMLDNRRKSVEKGLEDARIASDARANAEKDAEDIISKAQAEASEIVREATQRAEEAGREVKAAAEAEGEQSKESAIAEAKLERDRLLSDLRGQIASLAIAATQKLVGESLDEKRQRSLIDEFFSGVKDGQVVVLEKAELSGASAEITSAIPLTTDEQAKVKQDVLSKIGDKASIVFRVDPNILGGLIIRVGDKVIDNSVSGQLEELRQSIR